MSEEVTNQPPPITGGNAWRGDPHPVPAHAVVVPVHDHPAGAAAPAAVHPARQAAAQRVDVPEKFVVTFKPGKEMEEKVRELEERFLRNKPAEAAADENSQPHASEPPAA